MDTKDEMIEEISDVEEITPDKKIENVIEESVGAIEIPNTPVQAPVETVIPDNNISLVDEPTVVLEEIKDGDADLKKEESVEYKTIDEKLDKPEKKKSKAPLIVLLSILLVLDVAALAIYIIGIDKVLSFIK